MTEEEENEDKNNADYKGKNTDYDDDDRRC